MTEIFDIPQDETHLRIVAHRGTTVFAPENTAASFTCAGERHAWAIETDLRLTSDGEIVCIHNATTGAVFDRDLRVSEHTLAELRTLTARPKYAEYPPETLKIPTFGEYLDLCERFGSIPFIEIKDDVVKETVDELRRRGIEKRAVISSSDTGHLTETRKYSDGIFIHHIFSDEKSAKVMAELGNAGVAFNYPELDKVPEGFVGHIHSMGLKLCLRAGDTVGKVREMLAMGLDYIPSNCVYEL